MTIDTTNETVNNNPISQTISDKNTPYTTHKKWLCITLAAAALTLSACGKNDTPVTEGEPAVDGQTAVEEEATGVATANDPMLNDDVAVASADEGLAVDSDADMMNDDVAVASADDGMAIDESEVLDGSETEEHISTY